MKKILAMLLAAAMVLSLGICTAFADEEPAAEPSEGPVTVFVTIAVEGSFAVNDDGFIMACVPVVVEDANGNGFADIDDTLAAFHAEYCPDGYASEMGDWGLAITKLWNDESGSFGYYVDNASAWSLEDPVFDASSVYAFVYADQTAWSDAYTYFDVSYEEDVLSLTLFCLGYDEAWNVVSAPLAGAQICVYNEDGELVEIEGAVTDENGAVSFTVEEDGLFTAVVEDMVIVPPCVFASVVAE